jgi:predicted transcriptional regulator
MPKGIRAKANRTITVSIPRSLVDEIDAFAAEEKRTRSNWIVKELEIIVRRKTAKISALPLAAEEPGKYHTPDRSR